MATPKLDDKALAAQYGYAATFFNSVPELKKLLQLAVAGQWTTEQFSAKFMNTAWYKWQAAPFKEWQALVAKNPGEANKQVKDRTADIGAQAAKLGLTLDPKRLAELAKTSLMLGWNAGSLQRALADEMVYKPGAPAGGDIASTQSQIKEAAAMFGVSLGDKDIFSMSQKIAGGAMSIEGVQEYVKNLAKSRYPGLVDEIDKGLSLREVASSYVQAQAKILEIDPNQVDLASDKSLQKALQYVDPATGKPGGAMPLWQYEESLRKDSRWLATDNARNEIVGTGMKVLKDLGLAT